MISRMEFDVHITEELLRRVALRRILRRWPLTLLAAVLIILASVPGLRSGQLQTISVVGLTALGMQLIIYAAFYIRQRRFIADWKRMQGLDPIHYTLSEETVRTTSNLGSSELKWAVFREFHEHPDYYLLGMGRAGQLTLPRAEVPPEAVAFIRQRFADHHLPTKKA